MVRISQQSCPNGTQEPQNTGCTTILPALRSVPTVEWIRDVLSRRVVSLRPLTVLRSVLADICRLHEPGAKLFANRDDWYVWIKRQHLIQTFALIAAAARSVNLELQPSKIQLWRASGRDPIPHGLQDKIKLTLIFLGGHLQIHGDIEPSPIVLGEQASMEHDLLTMYVGAAKQHVLHLSFVPVQEVQNFDTQVTVFWSHIIQRGVTSPLFFLPLKLGGLGMGSAVQRHAAAPWRAWQSVIPTLMATTRSPDTDTFFNATPRLRAQLAQLQTTLSLHINKTAFLLKPLGAVLRKKVTQEKQVSTDYPKEYPQATS